MEDPRCRAYIEALAGQFFALAIADFNRQQRFDNEWRISETTPPKYVASFELDVYADRGGLKFRFLNTDPAASWVEYGAHAGGRTFVLRYKPMTHALESMSGSAVG